MTPRYLRPGRPATKIKNKVLPGYVYHVTQRGTDRQNVFRQAGDRDVYLDLLRDQRQDAGVSLQTYCSGGSTGDMRNLSTRATAAPDTVRAGIRGQARRPTPKVWQKEKIYSTLNSGKARAVAEVPARGVEGHARADASRGIEAWAALEAMDFRQGTRRFRTESYFGPVHPEGRRPPRGAVRPLTRHAGAVGFSAS